MNKKISKSDLELLTILALSEDWDFESFKRVADNIIESYEEKEQNT